MQRSVYLDREDTKSVEEEERNLFIKGVLKEIGVPLEDVWPNTDLALEDKIKLRNLLEKLEIEIIDDGNRGCDIYNNNTKLGTWTKPKFILRQDNGARNPKKRLFYEMIINTWSVFDIEEKNDFGEL